MVELIEVLDRLIDRTAGIAGPNESVEAFGVDESETTVRAYGGEVESLSSARTRGVGIRVIDSGRVGYAYTVDTSEDALAAALDDARRNTLAATPDEANVLPEPASGWRPSSRGARSRPPWSWKPP
jgi:PmbA protein